MILYNDTIVIIANTNYCLLGELYFLSLSLWLLATPVEGLLVVLVVAVLGELVDDEVKVLFKEPDLVCGPPSNELVDGCFKLPTPLTADVLFARCLMLV